MQKSYDKAPPTPSAMAIRQGSANTQLMQVIRERREIVLLLSIAYLGKRVTRLFLIPQIF